MEYTADILKITLLIQKDYPELSKYITEIPVTIPDVQHPEINVKTLQDYYNTLSEILKMYAPTHSPNTSIIKIESK